MDDSRCGRRARRLILASIVALAATLFPSITFAQRFDDVGVRAQGMAGAFVAVADDSSATWWNPAGLATGLSIVDLSGEIAQRGGGGVALTFPSLGLSYYRVKTPQIQALSPIAPSQSVRQDNGVVSQFGATFGHSIFQQLVVATTLKVVNAQSDTQADLDVGAMASLGAVRLGVTVRDLRSPTFGSGADAFELERRARAGAAVLIGGRGALEQVVIAADADLNTASVGGREEREVTAGVETWWLGRRLGVRGGGGANTSSGGGAFGALGVTVVPYPRLNVDAAMTRGADAGRDRWTLGLRLTF